MYYVYILISLKDGKYYTGMTDNIDRRVKQHNTGHKATRSTYFRGPFKLIFVQECQDKDEARSLEIFLKSGSGRELREILLE